MAAGTFVLLWNLIINLGSFGSLAFLITELRGLVDWEREAARTDFLTGLPNSRAFYEALSAELLRTRRRCTALSLAYLDVDDFKQLNDRLGHQEGDKALRGIAVVIRRNVRDHDVVARLGGDEFGVLLPETGPDDVRAALDRLLASLVEAVASSGSGVGFSVGAVTSLDGECDGDEILRRADNLMYLVKQSGRSATRYEVLDVAPLPARRPPGI